MRKKHTPLPSLFDRRDLFTDHQYDKELRGMSALIDAHPEFVDMVAKDLGVKPGTRVRGRDGLPAECVLRCAIIAVVHQMSYRKLEYHLLTHDSFRAFCRIPWPVEAKKSVLHRTISSITDTTWGAINRVLVKRAKKDKIEKGKTIRIDSTAVDALMHSPTDDSLLWDCVRVMSRLLEQAEKLPSGDQVTWSDHRLAAKRRHKEIAFKGGKGSLKNRYRQLIGLTQKTAQDVVFARAQMKSVCASPETIGWCSAVDEFLTVVHRVIDQTDRRVLRGENVDVDDKLVSVFETHADIIVKGSRKIQFGHKVNLVTGPSGMVLDLVVEDGNPADSDRLLPMIDRQTELYGVPPLRAATDGGYASQENASGATERGVAAMVFHKKRGISVEAMVGEGKERLFRRLVKFRAGVEANISCLKRVFGFGRCRWRGLGHFKSYVWAAAVSYNMLVMARCHID
jgi:IS5 family transposase